MTATAMAESTLSRVVRLRPDVEWSPFSTGVRPTWVARDPVSLEYFHFSLRERSVALLLDGQRCLQDVLNAAGSDGVTAEWLVGLVAKLENSCLIVPSQASLTGRRLWLGRLRQRHSGFLQRVMSPLAVRIKLFDPTGLLELLAPVAQMLFNKIFVSIWLVLVIIAGFLVAVELLESPSSLTRTFAGITTARAVGLVLIFACVKSLHELGHALACKKWKAECHEIGIFFLVFTPCLYCDASDSWKLSSRWRRACIAAAGIYVELTLAAVAGYLWLITAPESVFHLLAANVMLICSLSTVLVNANPLLRYDGYYALSDLWGVPNLHEQSREASRATAIAWLTARRLPRTRWDGHPHALALYGLAAWVYRHFVMIMIIWVVWLLLDGVGLPLLGGLLVVFTLANLLLANIMGAVRWIKELSMAGHIRTLRLISVFVALLLGFFLVFSQPWPTFVASRAVAYLADVRPVYAEHTGRLVDFQRAGQAVADGTQIAQIESPELEIEWIETRGKVAFLEQRVAQLRGRLVDDEAAASELATAVEELSKARERLTILESEQASLISHAHRGGVLLAGQQAHRETLTELPNLLTAKPLLSLENLGCAVERGALLGWLAETQTFEVTAYVIEHDAEILSVGMPVRCRWDCDVRSRYDGKIKRVSPEPILQVPESLLGDESIPFTAHRDGQVMPARPHYEVEIELEAMSPVLGHQSVGTVHFETAPRTLFQSTWQLLDRHIRPDL